MRPRGKGGRVFESDRGAETFLFVRKRNQLANKRLKAKLNSDSCLCARMWGGTQLRAEEKSMWSIAVMFFPFPSTRLKISFNGVAAESAACSLPYGDYIEYTASGWHCHLAVRRSWVQLGYFYVEFACFSLFSPKNMHI